MSDEREQELVNQITTLEKELRGIRDTRQRKADEELIGKCFKIRTGHGYDEDDDYWWIYAKAIRTKSSQGFYLFKFWIDNHGTMLVTPYDSKYLLSDLYLDISEDEFNEAWADFLGKLNTYAKVLESPNDQR